METPLQKLNFEFQHLPWGSKWRKITTTDALQVLGKYYDDTPLVRRRLSSKSGIETPRHQFRIDRGAK